MNILTSVPGMYRGGKSAREPEMVTASTLNSRVWEPVGEPGQRSFL